MVHEMKLKAVYFNLIKSGEKIYEIRLNDEKRKLIKVGDIVLFKKEPELSETLQTEVEDLIYFSSFAELLETLPLDKIGFAGEKVENVRNIYHSFYSSEDEKKYGVLSIKVKLT